MSNNFIKEHQTIFDNEIRYWLELGLESIIQRTNILGFMPAEDVFKWKNKVIEYFDTQIKDKIPYYKFGSTKPKVIAALIIWESLRLPEHFTIYGKNGASLMSLISISH